MNQECMHCGSCAGMSATGRCYGCSQWQPEPDEESQYDAYLDRVALERGWDRQASEAFACQG